VLENAGVYNQPAGQPVKDSTFDVTAVHAGDSVFSFTAATLAGDFYNGYRGGPATGGGGPGPAPAYLTALSLDATSAVTGQHGKKVTMTVNGTPTVIAPGASYSGAIVVTAA
jgi:hypothetical protein